MARDSEKLPVAIDPLAGPPALAKNLGWAALATFAGCVGALLVLGPGLLAVLLFLAGLGLGIGSALVRSILAAGALAAPDPGEELRRQIRKCRYLEFAGGLGEQAASQVEQLDTRYKGFVAQLGLKFEPGELAFARYHGAATALRDLVLENLHAQAVALSSLGPEDSAASEERRSLRAREIARIGQGLAQNEQALTELERLSQALAAVETKRSPERLEALLGELTELAGRVKKYEKKKLGAPMEKKTEVELTAVEPESVKQELGLAEPNALHIAPGEEQELDAQAAGYVDKLLSFSAEELEARKDRKEAVEQMGAEVQKRAAKQSELLRQPIRQLAGKSGEGSDVADALINLKVKVEELDPGKFDFEPGWLSRTLGRLPGVGTPLQRYFTKYESAQTVIGAVIRSLENGRDQLVRDNITLEEDQKQMRATTIQLEKAVRLAQLIDQKLEYKLSREIQAADPKHAFVQEELLFPLRQRIIDLQQQLAVHQQGVLASEIIIRNNKELSRGVNRALNVTVTALEVGATVAMALANQRIVMEKVDTVSKATSDLIAGTAARLKTQGAQIQKQAASAQLDLNSLKNAFADIRIAMDDLASFRRDSLPKMAETILEMDKISAEAEKAVKKLEEGNKARPSIQIAVKG